MVTPDPVIVACPPKLRFPFTTYTPGFRVSAPCELRVMPPQKVPGLIVWELCDPRLRPVVPHDPTVGAARSAIGSVIWGTPVRAAGEMPLQPPEQPPAISVLALPVVVIVSGPPVILIASDAL